MPYNIRKANCKQTDGDRGSYVLSYTDNKGKRHSNCHTSRRKAKAQIAAIEMPEGIEESWMPLAARITQLLEEELAELAGAFRISEATGDPNFSKGDRIRPTQVSSEMMVHTHGKVPHGTILRDNDDGTYDVQWDPMEPVPSYMGSAEDEVTDKPEETVEYRVVGSRLRRAKPDQTRT